MEFHCFPSQHLAGTERRRERHGKDMSWCEKHSCIKAARRNKSDWEINFMFLLGSNKLFPAVKLDYPIDQWSVTWMLLVSPILQSPSLILGPQNSYLTLEMLSRLRRSLEMPGLWTMTFVLDKGRLREVPNLVVPEETKHWNSRPPRSLEGFRHPVIPRSTSASGGKGKCFSALGAVIVQVLITAGFRPRQKPDSTSAVRQGWKAGLQLCSDLPQGYPGGRHRVLGRKPHKPISLPSHHTQEQPSCPRNTSTGNFASGIRSHSFYHSVSSL